MQEQLNEIVNSLGTAEKELIEKNYLDKLSLWARLIDEVEAGLPFIYDIPNTGNYFQNTKSEYQTILDGVRSLNIVENASRITNLQNRFQNFAQQHFGSLVDQKQKIQAVTQDKTDINELHKVLAEAQEQAVTIQKQNLDFEKSFKANLEKQASGSQKVLATYFKKRLKDLKTNEATDPEKWLEKRNQWFKTLLAAILTAGIAFLAIFNMGWLKGYELQLTLMKVAIIAVLYLQYHFAAKNYHIYADLVAKYEHLAVISETMTDFTAAAFENEELNTVVYTNAAKTLFSEVNTGHLKQVVQEASVIENFINQIPKGGQ